MAIVVNIAWPEITPELYDQARERVRWEEEPPEGAVLHLAWFDGGMRVIDVWESQGQFERFIAERIGPVVKGELGVTSDPEVTFSSLHRRFVFPGVTGGA
ncbi:hypothetical protein ACH44C_20345 [Streptomyces purpureus]|uniref:hypothetical protein n=1 Tax=Streptomyces purpureus TaxID=1951 RepID=UPI00037C154D|nr:hypothetical protein [Streptomyces purpureus]